MTKISAWKCDICERLFLEDDAKFFTRSSITLDFSKIIHNAYSSVLYAPCVISFDDVCLDCRNNLVLKINDSIGKKRIK